MSPKLLDLFNNLVKLYQIIIYLQLLIIYSNSRENYYKFGGKCSNLSEKFEIHSWDI